MTAIDTTYQLQPGESIAAYTMRIAAYNSSSSNPNGANPNAVADQTGVLTDYNNLPASVKPQTPVAPVTPTGSTNGSAPPSGVSGLTKNANGSYSFTVNGQTINNFNPNSANASNTLKNLGLDPNLAGQLNSYINPAPAITTPGNPVTPPSGVTPPTLPNANAPAQADQFNVSLAATLASQQKQLQDALAARTQSYQTQIDHLNQQNSDLQSAQDMGLANEQSTVAQETQAKQAALQQEQAQFQANYDARQQLTDQLTGLLTTGQNIIEGMKATTGLSSIMSPRISQTMADVQGQAGVITAALAAYDTQIGLAQSQLSSATAAITSIYGDQISYWNTVIDFYSNQEKANVTEIASLTKDQKTYIDAQIQTLQDNVTNTQQSANIIQAAMLDPTKALAFAKAGVSLTDSPQQINQKLALQAQADANVWGDPYNLGGDIVQKNKLTGEIRTAVNVTGSGNTTNPTVAIAALQSQIATGKPLSDGTPVVDANGYMTPAAWTTLIAHAPDENLSRADFIKNFGYLVYNDSKNGISTSYHLTPAEQKLISGVIE